MLFNSIAYLIFLPIVFGIYWALPHKYRWFLLLISSQPFKIIVKKSGELDYVVSSAKKQQKNKDVMVGLAYNQQDAVLKIENVNYYQPEIVAIGSSRVQGFVEDYFNCEFYNCSSGANSVFNSTIRFLENMNYTPKVVITYVDPWGFNEKWKFSDFKDNVNDIGFFANFRDTGYRADGSYYYGQIYREPKQSRFDDTINRIDNGISRFEYGYLDKIHPICEDLFNKYDFEYYNYMNPDTLKLEDDHFVDGFHTGEVAYGILLKDMLDEGSVLKKYVDEEKLDEMLENAYSELCFSKPE